MTFEAPNLQPSTETPSLSKAEQENKIAQESATTKKDIGMYDSGEEHGGENFKGINFGIIQPDSEKEEKYWRTYVQYDKSTDKEVLKKIGELVKTYGKENNLGANVKLHAGMIAFQTESDPRDYIREKLIPTINQEIETDRKKQLN